MPNSDADEVIIDLFVAATDTFFEERRCLLEDTGEGCTASVVPEPTGAERRFPKDKGESRRNQLPLVETSDLRATAINFFVLEIVYFRLIFCFC